MDDVAVDFKLNNLFCTFEGVDVVVVFNGERSFVVLSTFVSNWLESTSCAFGSVFATDFSFVESLIKFV